MPVCVCLAGCVSETVARHTHRGICRAAGTRRRSWSCGDGAGMRAGMTCKRCWDRCMTGGPHCRVERRTGRDGLEGAVGAGGSTG
jgi:hypothetical protein